MAFTIISLQYFQCTRCLLQKKHTHKEYKSCDNIVQTENITASDVHFDNTSILSINVP